MDKQDAEELKRKIDMLASDRPEPIRHMVVHSLLSELEFEHQLIHNEKEGLHSGK